MNIGIVGSGKIVSELLGFIHTVKGINIAAIIGRKSSEEKVRAIAQKNNIPKVYFDYQEALKDCDIEFMYIALTNNLHFEYAKKALMAGKNVICEKPFTASYLQARELSDIARKNHLYLFEAITNQYVPNYLRIKESLKELGNIKIVSCNYSQYSSRYDNFKKGIIQPAFDPVYCGGALYDINIYNIYFVIGLFSMPQSAKYFPNIERNVDTSGIAVLNYKDFQCVCIGSKDCDSPVGVTIQADNGYIFIDGPASVCHHIVIDTKEGRREYTQDDTHRMAYEFMKFREIYENSRYDIMIKNLDKSLEVMSVVDMLRNI